ncbi:MAG: TolC family outer membrane protein [Zoogloeaceae bacterium]|nr:TolC family outer membrane protein [Zoogloeaceae bacterium]
MSGFIRLLVVLCLTGAAARGMSMDLLQVWQQAKANDARIATARAELAAGREQAPQALSGLLPTVTLTGETLWNDTESSTGGVHTARRYNTHAHTLALTQPVFRWQNWLAWDQGRQAAAMAEVRFAAAEQELILRVAEAYFDALNAEATLEAARAQKSAIGEQLEQARRSFEVGATTIVDSYEAQSRYDLAEAQVIAGENELEVKHEALRLLIGELPASLARLETTARLETPQPAKPEAWVTQAREQNLAVQVQARQAEIAALEVDKTRAEHYPTLDFVARGGQRRSVPNAADARPRNEELEVGLQLTVPLFQGGHVASKTREARARAEAATATLETLRREAALLARQSYLGVVNGLAQIRALEAALTSSLAALESNKLGYEVGVRINIDVLNAEQQVFYTRRDLARAWHDSLLARLKLRYAVGTLDEAEVRAVNALLRH